MLLPETFSSWLWSGSPSSLAGVSLGDARAALTLPEWCDETADDGQYGWLNVSTGGVRQLLLSVNFPKPGVERVKSIDVHVECDDDDAEAAVYDELAAALASRLGKPSAKTKKALRFEHVVGNYSGTVTLRRAGFSSDTVGVVCRVELSLAIDDESALEAKPERSAQVADLTDDSGARRAQTERAQPEPAQTESAQLPATSKKATSKKATST